MATVLIPIPARDFDPSEVAISWKVLRTRGHVVAFATPDGREAVADEIMIDGVGLDPWSRVPILRRLRIIGLMLRANADARSAYRELTQDPGFVHPLRWDELGDRAFDGLLLPGGHRARGMRAYLESPVLQNVVARYFAAGKPVAAICHGVLLAARSRGEAGRSVLYGRKTTALTWRLEKAADTFARVGRFWDRTYYRTYVEAPGEARGFMSVEREVTRALADARHFVDVPKTAGHYAMKTSGLARDTERDARPAWVVRDGNYVSARWPGDAHTFAKTFAEMLSESAGATSRG